MELMLRKTEMETVLTTDTLKEQKDEIQETLNKWT